MQKTIAISLILSSMLLATESIYDGTGSLIAPTDSQGNWGATHDQANMQAHKDKTSTVSFQILGDVLRCDHVDIHSEVDLKHFIAYDIVERHICFI